METEYFKKWLDEKFNELGGKIDSLNKATEKEIVEMKRTIRDLESDHRLRIEKLEQDQKTINQKIWIATGGLIIISGIAVYFLATFKQLNEYQVTKAVMQALSETKLK